MANGNGHKTPVGDNWQNSSIIPKDPNKCNIPSYYRPVTCLPTMYKAMTAVGTEGWARRCSQLLTDNSVRDCRNHMENLMMGWMNYRKAYDMVPHTWIQEALGMMEIAGNISEFMLDSMQKWKKGQIEKYREVQRIQLTQRHVIYIKESYHLFLKQSLVLCHDQFEFLKMLDTLTT